MRIAPETARHVLWLYGADGGYTPGSFTQRLMGAIAAADRINSELLRTIYPALVAAMDMAGNTAGGIEELQAIAGGLACIRCGDTDGPFDGAPKQPLCEGCYGLPVTVQ